MAERKFGKGGLGPTLLRDFTRLALVICLARVLLFMHLVILLDLE